MLGLSRALFFAEGIAGTASYRGLQGSQEAGAAVCPGRTEPGTGLVVGQGPRHCPAPLGAESGVSPSSHIPFPKPAPFCRALFGCRDADGVGGLELGSSGVDSGRESKGSPGGWRRLFSA